MDIVKKIIFVLILVFLPSQLGLHFWPDWAFIRGIRTDYFSPTLYFTDLLIILFIILSGKMLSLRSSMTALFVLILIFLNIYFSLSPFVSLYKWLKVLEFGLLVICIRKNFDSKYLLIPIVFESVLAFWQFLSQSSIGDLWYFLGERTFSNITPGIANTSILGNLVLRPYATFSHPNVLAGFLVVAIVLILTYLPHISRRITASILGLGVATIFLTMSRSAIIALLLFFIFWFKQKSIKVILLGFLITLIFLGSNFRQETEPYDLRQKLNVLAIEQFRNNIFVGTGLGTSPLYDFSSRQPVHNVYLMLLSETGLIGLMGFLLIIKKRFSWVLLPILFLGLFDHYFLTQQQGQLLLALVLGLGYNSSSEKHRP